MALRLSLLKLHFIHDMIESKLLITFSMVCSRM
ncbi:hypothetical protein PITC_042490 [Penicillium italicum]|uniref:Uncharacterized protein n=1 Tax=Penicillium italicum TaxID=40296 RepID=A0A0A2L8Z8_PENIT|nr:hypothetical protein PITC_042490 [Penicillium italicum]